MFRGNNLMFEIKETFIKDLFVIQPTIFADSRGFFAETYNAIDFQKMGITYTFVQDNQSKSCKGVLRGLHFQKKHPQAKLVRVIDGEVYDVAVDLRKDSPTYGKYFGTILSSKKNNMLMIPKGFAHGFVVLSETAIFVYKCDDFYHPEDEGGVLWNDPDIGIEWPIMKNLILSEKDRKYPLLKDCKVAFKI